MGCSNSKVSEKLLKSIVMVPFQYEGIGLLTAKIHPVVEVNRCQRFYSKDTNFLQLTICNQQFIVPLIYDPHPKQTLKPLQNQFDFFINKVDVQKCLQVKILTQSSLKSLSKTASGRQVLKQSFFLSKDKSNTQKKSYNMELTSQKDVKVGWVRVQLAFQPGQYDILTIRVNAATLINSTQKNRKVYVNIKIGGQQYETQSSKFNDKTIPSWQNAMHSFIVPKSLKIGKLLVYERDQYLGVDYLIGELVFDLELILMEDSIQSFSEEITLKNKVTGTIFLMFLKTKNQIPQNINLQPPKRIKIKQEIPQSVFDYKAYYMVGKPDKKVSSNTASTSNTQQNIMLSKKLTKKLTQFNQNKHQHNNKQNIQQHIQKSSNLFECYQQIQRINQVEVECSNQMQTQNVRSPFRRCDKQNGQQDSQLYYSSGNIPQTLSYFLDKQLPLNSGGNEFNSSRSSQKSSLSRKKQSSIKIDIISNLLSNEFSKKSINLFNQQQQMKSQKKSLILSKHLHEKSINNQKQNNFNNEIKITQRINIQKLMSYEQQMGLKNDKAKNSIEQFFIQEGFPTSGLNLDKQISQAGHYYDQFQIKISSSSISSKTHS